jgi:hypothetical protein
LRDEHLSRDGVGFRGEEAVMKWIKAIAAAVLVGTITTGNALADGRGHGHFHGHGHFNGHARLGVFIGVPLFAPWYYPPPYYYPPPSYYYPPVVAVPSSPPVYIERGDDHAPTQSYYWYHCSNPEGYYPYVKQCPSGWQQVAPQPPPG